jgi:curved DNA-binding protein CbpA
MKTPKLNGWSTGPPPTITKPSKLSPNASKEVIKRAYRTLVEKYHPDKHPETRKVWAEEMTKQLNEAFSVLSDEEKRKEYNDERRRHDRI